MDSPSLQSTSQGLRSHHNSFSSPHQPQVKLDNRGGIHKRNSTTDRHRSFSLTKADRLYRLAANEPQQQQSNGNQTSIPSSTVHGHWITPQQSPQLSGFATEAHIESFPQWTVPTPPRSDSGIPNEPVVTTGISGAQEFAFDQPTVAADMSSLGFLLPSQYGIEEPFAAAMESNFPPMRSQPPAAANSSAYASTASSSPAMYPGRTSDPSAPRRPAEMSGNGPSPYAQDYRRTSNPYDSGYSVAPSQTIPSISGLTHSPLPSPHMSSTSAPQSISYTRSPNMYDSNMYAQQQSYTSAPPGAQMYAAMGQQGYAPPPFVGSSVNEVLAKPLGNDASIRVLNQRPKPQCWEHGCNGRQFSTFSNLLRHQREKSGTAAKSYCPKCGAEFTRTTARNGHLAHDKCTKPRRPSDGKP